MKVGNGMNTHFWTDRWFSDNAFASSYAQLYNYCTLSDITDFEVIMSQGRAFSKVMGLFLSKK
jgi:hypothetical protein